MDIKCKLFSVSKNGCYRIIEIFGIKIKFFSKALFERVFRNQEKQIAFLFKIFALMYPLSNLPKAGGELRKGQLLSIEILKDLKQVCEENNITYWIDFGTLLGAVRHGGYIPWDSDTDTSMLREDFNKVIPLLKEKYKNTNIEVREFGGKNHFQLRIQPKDDDTYGVDIFPVDKYYRGNLNEEEISDISLKIKRVTENLKKKCKLSKRFFTNANKFRPYIKEFSDKYILENNISDTSNPALYYGIDYPIPYKTLIKNYETVFPLKTITFEGVEYSCPNNIERCLIDSYGKNYMDYPSSFKPDEDKIMEYISSLSE